MRPRLTWHLIGRVRRLARLRRAEAGAVAEPRLQGGLALGQAALCLNAWQHHAEVWNENNSLSLRRSSELLNLFTMFSLNVMLSFWLRSDS